mmetsp:Transcript_18816/g.40510  ORF Transcript_18816/g.40510 Transcript_18816/m.40510 type:complete len:87 (+) Transcript_18816:343-603(+)
MGLCAIHVVKINRQKRFHLLTVCMHACMHAHSQQMEPLLPVDLDNMDGAQAHDQACSFSVEVLHVSYFKAACLNLMPHDSTPPHAT